MVQKNKLATKHRLLVAVSIVLLAVGNNLLDILHIDVGEEL